MVKTLKKLLEEWGEGVCVSHASKHLARFGIYVKNTAIYIADANQPLGNGLWGVVDFLEALKYRVVDRATYNANKFGEDGLNFYPWKRGR